MRKIIIAAITCFIYSFALSQDNVALFEQCNYGGQRSYLKVGSYRLYQMQISNDQLSSIQIPQGLRLTIYEHDDFKGRSASYTSNVSCLDQAWNDNASSVVVESMYGNNYSMNEFVTFYNDCYTRGHSQSLRPGTYSGAQLGLLKYNISSFVITGNLQVKVYTNNENAYGYATVFQSTQNCLGGSHNDKIASLVIEPRPYQQPNPTNYGNGSFATIYTECNYGGSSLRLAPGYYQGDKLGLLKYDISSVELPSNLVAKVFVNNESLSGYSYTLTENSSCLSNTLNNRIGSLVIEERGSYNNNPYNNNNNQPADQAVIIYSDANYRGLSSSLLPGTYATMALAGFNDDALSSLSVPAGYRVVIYEYENFRGKSYTITQSKPAFFMSGWNDKTSSIAVYRN